MSQPSDAQTADLGSATAQTATGDTAAAPASTRRRGGLPDLVISLLVVTGVVVALLLLTPRPGGGALSETAYSAALQNARLVAPYALVVPGSVPPGWQLVQAGALPGPGSSVVWRFGLRAADGSYVTVEQSPDGQGNLATAARSAGTRLSPVQVGGTQWQRYQTAPAQRGLLGSMQGTTVVLTGNASWAQLTEVAGLLRGGRPAVATLTPGSTG